MRSTRRMVLTALAVVAAVPGTAQTPEPPLPRVAIVTTAGTLTVEIETKRAPLSAANFLRYVDDGRFDGVSFYRTARNKQAPRYGFVQSGIRTDARRFLDMIPHESTRKTGIRHLDMTISMARKGPPGSANGNFFITVGAAPWMDFKSAADPGYAAFGRVVGGQATVKRLLAAPTGAQMNGTLMLQPVRVNRAVRLDGNAQPTGRPRPWLIERRTDG